MSDNRRRPKAERPEQRPRGSGGTAEGKSLARQTDSACDAFGPRMGEVPPLKERRLEVLPREIDAMESPPRFVLVVHRRYECSRLEKDFLAAAYQQVIPEIRRPQFEKIPSQMAPSASFDHDIFPSRKIEGAP